MCSNLIQWVRASQTDVLKQGFVAVIKTTTKINLGRKGKGLFHLRVHLFSISLPSSAVRCGEARAVCPSVIEIPAPWFSGFFGYQFPSVKGGWAWSSSTGSGSYSLIVSIGAAMSQSAGKTLEVSWAPSFPSPISSFKSSVQGFIVLAPVARYFD